MRYRTLLTGFGKISDPGADSELSITLPTAVAPTSGVDKVITCVTILRRVAVSDGMGA